MPRNSYLLIALATLSTPLLAQNAYISASNPTPATDAYTQSQPAPIEHSYTDNQQPDPQAPPPPRRRSNPNITEAEPAPGIFVRADHPLQTVAADNSRVELRLDHGRANVMVHNPAPNTLTLIDLPGGQVQLLKDGLYTFNAETNTVRVLHGEADAFIGTTSKSPRKVKEDQQITLTAQGHAADFDRYYARQDLLPGAMQPGETQQQPNGYAQNPYGDVPPPAYGYYGPYGDGYYAYPYYAYGYPYWGWGYPFFGFGWGGYRGGYVGYGFHGYGYGGFARGGGRR